MRVDVTKRDIQNIFKILKKSCESVEKFEIVPLSENPIGFWGDHYILRIFSDDISFELFLKAIPRHNAKRFQYIQETGFFAKEIKLYEDIIPKLNELSSIFWAPKSFLTKSNHFIVLENLKDFRLFNSKQLVFDFEHCKMAVKTLAILHASTIIFEEKFGKFSPEYLKILEETSYPNKIGHIRTIQLDGAIKILTKLIQIIPKYQNTSQISDAIIVKISETFRKIYMFVESSTKYRNVLSHGDIWVNNIMFKYSSSNDKLEDCRFVDFQFSRYAPPAVDLATLIFTSTTFKFRQQHLENILNIYCDSFENELKLSKINPAILSRDEIIKSFNGFRLAGLIEGAVFGHLTLLPSDLASNMMNSSEEYEKFITQSREDKCLKAFEENYYRDRMTEILTEIVDDFILN